MNANIVNQEKPEYEDFLKAKVCVADRTGFDIDLNEPVNDKTYYLLNIAEWRHYLLPEFGSEKIRKKSYNNESYQVFGLYVDY